MSDDAPQDGYDALAVHAADLDGTDTPWGDNPFQAHYSWPATRALLPGSRDAPRPARSSGDPSHRSGHPDLDGRRVLDAGCGVGDHVGWLLDQGAEVVGLDASAAAVETARDRFGDRVTFHHADLADALPLADDAFDVVLSHLVLDHVPDLEATLAELRRVLADEAVLVATTVHPLRFHHEYDVRYYDTRPVEISWPDAATTAYHRPVGTIVDAVLDAGLRLETLDEPEPLESYAEHAPDRYAVAEKRPQVLCVRARA